MLIKSKKFVVILLIVLLAITNNITFAIPHDQGTDASSWIIKWKNGEAPEFNSISEVIEVLPELNVVIARSKETYDADLWIKKWQESSYVEYIQLNHKVEISAAPNDPLYASQTYLSQIKAEGAWDVVQANSEMTMAIVDTGVDLTHPDLKGNIVEGTNLINPGTPPQDDNGHGTNIAGILAAIGNNELGITGIMWQGNIMPIKAVESNGTTDESKLGQGIRYAVDHGANIVVLSLGLYKYSPFMRDIVQYAEQRNVLLVAASGNDGEAVKYPAAYPTVLAVGGLNANNQVNINSNYGQELDIVAPWKVYTTALDGLYYENSGTSMAAPQVAAVAALIWAKNPSLKTYEIRNLLRQTAEDIGPSGWDSRSGYGMLRADQALNQTYKKDLYEDNNSRSLAKIMPLDSMLSASIEGRDDIDWFSISAPYDGFVTLQFTAMNPSILSQLELMHYDVDSSEGTVYTDLSKPIQISTNKGQGFIEIKVSQAASAELAEQGLQIDYRVIPQFKVYRDAFEDNDRQYKAYVLPTQIQSIEGTFHQLNDEDWYALLVQDSGSLQIKVDMDTYRMDLELLIQKQGEKAMPAIDWKLDGGSEYLPTLDVLPGKYYIRVRNTISEDAHPVVGEYTLGINYLRKYVDPNEPNNRVFQATVMGLAKDYSGVFEVDDNDWYSFKVGEGQLTTMDLSNIPIDRMMSLTLLNNSQEQLSKDINPLGDHRMKFERELPAGTYYIRLTANQSFNYQMYSLKVSTQQLIAGYRDIKDHWAQADIVRLTELGIVNGYANHIFNPNKSITRAEAITMIVNALQLTTTSKPNFTDVNDSYWAYDEISIASSAGIINGYPDGTFRPDQPTNRVEMTAMIANALGITGTSNGELPFNDIQENAWSVNMLRQMKSEGWIKGYEDGSYKPLQIATRAEFVTFVSRVVE